MMTEASPRPSPARAQHAAHAVGSEADAQWNDDDDANLPIADRSPSQAQVLWGQSEGKNLMW